MLNGQLATPGNGQHHHDRKNDRDASDRRHQLSK
jgi:hypothetical protein